MENIIFKIGQPNTGKSFGFEKKYLEENEFDKKEIKYLKIPVSGGIGNEYKGLQNTDLAISYDPINESIRFGEFLQHLMRAIIHPDIPHVVFLDDFHNQDISSLLSEYTPLFKSQQKRDLSGKIKNPPDISTLDENIDSEVFIKTWNECMAALEDVPKVQITNRISGSSLTLVFPANFYLLGAANFNEKTLNIFADWADRAKIDIIDPLIENTREELSKKVTDETGDFIECCWKINDSLKEVLNENLIFDYEKYCFGIWKVVDDNGSILTDISAQKKTIKFFFAMIKNALIYNNKNSYVNTIGWELIKKMKDNKYFKSNFEKLYEDDNLLEKSVDDEITTDKEIFALLHSMNIYDN
jgi:hypothetical protein